MDYLGAHRFPTDRPLHAVNAAGRYVAIVNARIQQDAVLPDEQNLSRLGHKFKEVLKVGNEVWKQFERELLPELAPRSKWFKLFPNPQVDDVVLVIEEGTPKGQWKTAVITEVKHSSDGIIRSAKVRMNGKLYDRPLVSLFPLFDQK